ncbi:MAG: hypothetical protein ABSG26_04105 [Bryobacteraceae bacterium]|jgi:hypothetical protein
MTQKESVVEQRRQLACSIAIGSEKERELLSRTSQLRSEITSLEARDGALSLPADATKAALVAAQRGRESRLAKISNLKTELERLEPELSMVSAGLGVAHRALGAIEQKTHAERRVRISQAIAAAVAQAPGKQVFHDARAKCDALRKRLADVESELHVLETTAREPANVEDRAAQLLATGTMPPSGPVVDGSVRRSELLAESRTLAAAIRQQQSYVSAAGRQFCAELAVALRPIMGDIVERIAGGVTMARQGSEEAVWLETAAAVASGGESIPCVRFPGIPAPQAGNPDAFDFWLDRQRLAGFEV